MRRIQGARVSRALLTLMDLAVLVGAFYLGYVLLLQDKIEEAQAQFKRAIDLDPQYASAYANLGATFEVELKAGPTKLQTWFIEEDGGERGAYFVYVERL